MQKTNYYPYGLVMEQQNYFAETELKNNYLYNGKEWQNDQLANVSLDWYDYGARMYDPELGRWHVPDLLAESHFKDSPYNYVFNNPIRYIDLFGLDTLDVINVYAPRLYPPNESNDLRQRINIFMQYLRSLDDGGPIGNYNPRKVRDADSFERWSRRNFDPEMVQEMGEGFGASEAEPTLNNTVRTNESFSEETPDADIIKQHTGNDKTTSSGIRIDTFILIFDAKKTPQPTNGYDTNINDEKAKDRDTVVFRLKYYSNDKLDSMKLLRKSGNITFYNKKLSKVDC